MRLRILMLLIISSVKPVYSQSLNDTLTRIHTDLVYLDNNQKLAADLFFSHVAGTDFSVQYNCYRYNRQGDSLLMCRKQIDHISLKEKINHKTLLFAGADGPAYYLPVFYNILHKTGTVPPGNYKVFVTLKNDSDAYSRTFFHEVDSNLSPTSPLRKELNSTLLPENKARLLGIDFSKEAKVVNGLANNTAKAVDRAAGKIDRLFRSKD